VLRRGDARFNSGALADAAGTTNEDDPS
jgi:hypothetical protein